NPIYGLYASFAGPTAGGLFAGTRLMVISTTGAAALAAGSALSGVSPASRPGALFLLTLIAGALMLAAGLARLGRFTRFGSFSVVRGFLTGVGINIVLGQIPGLTGAPSHGSTSAGKAWNVITHPSAIEWQSLVVGLTALGLMAGLAQTRLGVVSSLVAIVVP